MLSNYLRLWILGDADIMGKTQKWVEPEPTIQSPYQKKLFGTSVKKLNKNKYQSFSSFPGLLNYLTLLH